MPHTSAAQPRTDDAPTGRIRSWGTPTSVPASASAPGKGESGSAEELAGQPIEPAELEMLIHEHRAVTRPRLQRLWDYYRNPMTDVMPGGGRDADANPHGRAYRTAQEQGLPPRLRRPSADPTRPARERVVENDIAWRIHALVDFVFGKPPVVQSLHADHARGHVIETFLRSVFDRAGGAAFFQTLGLLGSVYGQADVLLRIDAPGSFPGSSPGSFPINPDIPSSEGFHLDPVEATRGIPVLSRHDYRQLDAYLVHTEQPIGRTDVSGGAPGGFLARVRQRVLGRSGRTAGSIIEHTTLFTADRIEGYAARPTVFANRRTLVSSEVNPLGRIPLVHIQNLAQPFVYAGLSDVEPLIPLQDELNTRLSDRANRVTFQSFKMYLGKGIEGFTDKPVGPGQMWSTDNPDASIESFGGDGDSPSETAHINEVREALDKTSGVPPVAAGLLRDKVGNLTSENALRIVLMGMLTKAQKKRTTYGAGLARICELVLHAADVTGVLPNTPDERRVRFDWPDPLSPTGTQALRDAQTKIALGVPRGRVLAELGYDAAGAD